jgi:hypothetical protein
MFSKASSKASTAKQTSGYDICGAVVALDVSRLTAHNTTTIFMSVLKVNIGSQHR